MSDARLFLIAFGQTVIAMSREVRTMPRSFALTMIVLLIIGLSIQLSLT